MQRSLVCLLFRFVFSAPKMIWLQIPHCLIVLPLIFYALRAFRVFLNAWVGYKALKKSLVENTLVDNPPLHGHTSQILHIQPLLHWENITINNRLHSLRNLLIACLLCLSRKVLGYNSLRMQMTLLFLLVCCNIYNRCLCLHPRPKFYHKYLLPLNLLYFLEHLILLTDIYSRIKMKHRR